MSHHRLGDLGVGSMLNQHSGGVSHDVGLAVYLRPSDRRHCRCEYPSPSVRVVERSSHWRSEQQIIGSYPELLGVPVQCLHCRSGDPEGGDRAAGLGRGKRASSIKLLPDGEIRRRSPNQPGEWELPDRGPAGRRSDAAARSQRPAVCSLGWRPRRTRCQEFRPPRAGYR